MQKGRIITAFGLLMPYIIVISVILSIWASAVSIKSYYAAKKAKAV
ncbi:hypothetical protein [Fibrella forsythiae]|uniref:Uncharacterized protein n=1 Tax=Fibrella forsythiae TaxID=2817061 RepID=A0ABS3JMG8_9BACT|nr:hypothetical protein [Fibrella forsythiae]MBO0951205.1 hypothetical protein [Fibrella forsythiae]